MLRRSVVGQLGIREHHALDGNDVAVRRVVELDHDRKTLVRVELYGGIERNRVVAGQSERCRLARGELARRRVCVSLVDRAVDLDGAGGTPISRAEHHAVEQLGAVCREYVCHVSGCLAAEGDRIEPSLLIVLVDGFSLAGRFAVESRYQAQRFVFVGDPAVAIVLDVGSPGVLHEPCAVCLRLVCGVEVLAGKRIVPADDAYVVVGRVPRLCRVAIRCVVEVVESVVHRTSKFGHDGPGIHDAVLGIGHDLIVRGAHPEGSRPRREKCGIGKAVFASVAKAFVHGIVRRIGSRCNGGCSFAGSEACGHEVGLGAPGVQGRIHEKESGGFLLFGSCNSEVCKVPRGKLDGGAAGTQDRRLERGERSVRPADVLGLGADGRKVVGRVAILGGHGAQIERRGQGRFTCGIARRIGKGSARCARKEEEQGERHGEGEAYDVRVLRHAGSGRVHRTSLDQSAGKKV